MKQLVPWATSIITLWGIWSVGNKHWWGWIIGIANQLLWVLLAVLFAAWGLLPLTAALIVVYSRNLAKWRRAC